MRLHIETDLVCRITVQDNSPGNIKLPNKQINACLTFNQDFYLSNISLQNCKFCGCV